MCLSHRETDRISIGFEGGPVTIWVDGDEELKKYLKISSKIVVSVQCHVIPDERIMKMFQKDILTLLW